MPRCDDCSNRRCSCVLVDGDNTEVLGTGSPTDPYRVNATGGDGASLWEPGDVKPTARGAASVGWLLCNGAAVSRTTYAALYAAIGTTFGAGDGTNTFNLPDLAGRFPFGADGTAPRGSVGGIEQIVLTEDNLPPHVHTITHTHTINHDHSNTVTDAQGNHVHGISGANHRHTVNQSNDDGTNNQNFRRGAQKDREVDTSSTAPDLAIAAAGIHAHNVDIPAFFGNSGGPSQANSGSVGNALPFSNMPPYTAINYVIKT